MASTRRLVLLGGIATLTLFCAARRGERVAATRRISLLEYDTTTPDGFAYIHSGDPITIEGVGLGALIAITPPGSVPVNPTAFLGLEVDSGGAPVTLSNLHFTLPTPPDAPD